MNLSFYDWIIRQKDRDGRIGRFAESIYLYYPKYGDRDEWRKHLKTIKAGPLIRSAFEAAWSEYIREGGLEYEDPRESYTLEGVTTRLVGDWPNEVMIRHGDACRTYTLDADLPEIHTRKG
jgi:hypothetical protein